MSNKKGTQRGLSEDFLSKINTNNLAESVKTKNELEPNKAKTKEQRPRSSVHDNIAMFQAAIDVNTGRSKPDSAQAELKLRKVNNNVSCAIISEQLLFISNDYLLIPVF